MKKRAPYALQVRGEEKPWERGWTSPNCLTRSNCAANNEGFLYQVFL